MPQTGKKKDSATPAENSLPPSITKWKPDTQLKFDRGSDNVLWTTPDDFLVAEHQEQDMVFSIIHHGKMIQVSKRMGYHEFRQHMPDGLMQELVRGVAIRKNRITEIHPESRDLYFGEEHKVKLQHVVSSDTLRHFGDEKPASGQSTEEAPKNS